MRNRILLLVLVLSLQCISYGAAASSNQQKPTFLHNQADTKNDYDLEFLLDGVSEITIGGTAGAISVFGESAFPVISGVMNSGGTDVYHPIVAASTFGYGKIVGASHNTVFHPEDVSNEPSGRNKFILNALRWATSGSNYWENIAVLVDYPSDEPDIVEFLTQNGYFPQRIFFHELHDASQLYEYGAVMVVRSFHADKALILKSYLEYGGGLLVSLTSWAHDYFEPVPWHFGENYAGNVLSTDSGFAWHRDSYAGPTKPGDTFTTNTSYLAGTHVREAWEKVKEYLITGQLNPSNQSIVQFADIFENGIELIPSWNRFWQDNNFYEEALNFTQVDKQPIPSKDKPVVDFYDKLVLRIFHGLSTFALQPHDVKAHPSSAVFPGNLTMPNDIQNTEFSISIRTKKSVMSFVPKSDSLNSKEGEMEEKENIIEVSNKFPLWYSTGLYAPPGSVISATITPHDDNDEASLKNFGIQIGTHSDDLFWWEEWYRIPRIVSKKNFVNEEVSMASPYGGLIYVLIPEDALSENEKIFQVNVTGGVQAPFFKLGESSLWEWRDSLRYASGPWAEFVTDKIVLSVPSSSIRTLEDPEDLLLFWDQVMDAIADLAAIPRERYRQERIVPDVHIYTGGSHSGYPIMTSFEQAELAVNVSTLRREGSWDHFRELARNHELNDYLFDGTYYSSIMLFPIYVLNTVCGVPTDKTRIELSPEVYKKSVSDYIAGGHKYEDWKNSMFLSLMFYVQLEREYGWGAYKKVFAEYRKLEWHPGNDQEKIDLWLVIFSTVVKQDLSFYFESWGIPISAEASGSISYLPEAQLRISDLLLD